MNKPSSYINKKNSHVYFLFCVVWLLVFWGLLRGSELPKFFPDIVFVFSPSIDQLSNSPTMNQFPGERYVKGCQIVGLSFINKEKKILPLTSGFFSACDPEISFDGKRMLFSGKKQEKDHWQIWEMDLIGGKVKQITQREGDAVSPLYVGTLFHLNDQSPTEKILFQEAEQLYTCNLDGSKSRQITFSPNLQFSPAVLPNGRVIFSSAGKNIDLLAVNIDGTDLMGFLTASDVPGNKEMVRIGRDGYIYFIQNDVRLRLGGGTLSSVSMRRPTHSFQDISPDKNGYFHSPCPLPDGRLIVSFRPKTEKSRYGLYLLCPSHNEKIDLAQEKEVLFISDQYHCIDAQIITPREQVKGRSSFVAHDQDTGILYCLDVYISKQPEMNRLKKGTIKQVRVYTDQKVLGTAPVERDGSFHIVVPARTPLAFELLDEQGQSLIRQNSWSWVMPRESRGCIGCHEDRELAPPNKMAKAILKPAVILTQKSGKTKGKQ